jgi:hypothetical protein
VTGTALRWVCLLVVAASCRAEPPAAAPATPAPAPETGDRKPETGDRRPAAGDRKPQAAPSPGTEPSGEVSERQRGLPTPAPAPPPAGPPALCGRKPGQPIQPTPWPYPAHLGGGNDCSARETLWANVPHADRTCGSDADCAVITGNGNCFHAALNEAAAAKPAYAQHPCGNPASGACMPRVATPKCEAGCCVVGG